MIQTATGDLRELRFPGIYTLIFGIKERKTVRTGGLGLSTYRPAWYAYIGSALGGLSARIGHHLKPHGAPHWHIDYLLPHGKVIAIVATRTREHLECRLAASLAQRFPRVPHFGSSDCRCPGHLLYAGAWKPLADAVEEAIRGAGCLPMAVFIQPEEKGGSG